MSEMTKLLVVANDHIDSDEVCEAIIERAAAGPVEVTLVASESVGATADGRDAIAATRATIAGRMDRAVRRLRDAGVSVGGVVGGACGEMGFLRDVRDPSRFDEIVVCRPWLSCRRAVLQSRPRRTLIDASANAAAAVDVQRVRAERTRAA